MGSSSAGHRVQAERWVGPGLREGPSRTMGVDLSDGVSPREEGGRIRLHGELVNRCGDWDSPSVDWALQLCVCEDLQLEGMGGAAHRAQGAIWLPEGRSFHSCSCVSKTASG